MSEKRYAKFNPDGKTLQVGLGSNISFYASLGMKEMEVEQSDSGVWYPAGKVPKKPNSEVYLEKLNDYQKLLDTTDWYAVRYAETGVEIPQDIKNKRAEARKEIDRLRELLNDELAI